MSAQHEHCIPCYQTTCTVDKCTKMEGSRCCGLKWSIVRVALTWLLGWDCNLQQSTLIERIGTIVPETEGGFCAIGGGV
jgi:hypothetical protein